MRRALVTGASRGIGAAIARRLAQDGHDVILMGRQLGPLQALAAELKGRAIACDVTELSSVAAAFAEAGPLDILVNNAGAAESAPLARTSDELWQRMLAVNLTGTFLCSRAALSGMKGWGRIVNVASTAGQRGYAYVSAYAAAKHGVVGLTRSLALELAKSGITVNAVTETDLLDASVANIVAKTGRSEAEARVELARHNPQGRLVQPDEVAATVVWLCGEGASAITGQCLSVSGGEVMA
jgi:NAD(P)-dependent dehydrogenase (short-subunit alcohol dehydrogenase family)